MEKKHIKLIVFDVAMAILIVILYSPGLLALSPFDPGIIRPGLAIVCGIFIIAALLYANISTLRKTKKDYHQLDVEKSSSAQALKVMERYEKADVVGPVAATAKAEIESVEHKKDALLSVIENKFSKGSLTYDKFASVVEAAVSTVIKNTSILANRIQTFDTQDYRHIEMMLSTGSYKNDNIPDEIQEEKGRLYAKNMADMDAIIAANEKLLLELDRFAIEIGKLDTENTENVNTAMIEEVKQLIEETKYYE